MNIKNFTNDSQKILPHDFFTSLGLYVEAGFDQNKRKWFWSDGNEIKADHWFSHWSASNFIPVKSKKFEFLNLDYIIRFSLKKRF